MQHLAQSSYDGCYVHKLRLEAHDGARVEINSFDKPLPSKQTSWIVAKLIGASLAVASLLMLAARELAR